MDVGEILILKESENKFSRREKLFPRSLLVKLPNKSFPFNTIFQTLKISWYFLALQN